MMDRILDHNDVDVFGFWEDMAYKTAPLIGPDVAYHLYRIFPLARGGEELGPEKDG